MFADETPPRHASRRRRWIYAATIFSLLLLVSVGYLSLQSKDLDPALVANFKRVEVGMSYGDLTAILGRPTFLGRASPPDPKKPSAVAAWERGDTVLRVTLNEKQQVTSKTCEPKSLGRRLDEWFARVLR